MSGGEKINDDEARALLAILFAGPNTAVEIEVKGPFGATECEVLIGYAVALKLAVEPAATEGKEK